jgi:hypothetical protein
MSFGPTDNPLLNDLLRAVDDVLVSKGEEWALFLLAAARDTFLASLRPPPGPHGGNGDG